MQKIGSNKTFSVSKSIYLFGSISFVFILLFADINTYFFYPPQGIHLSRQTDSFSFSLYYFFTNANLFEPGNMNLESVSGKCAGEFPIIYYLASLLYKVFGVNFYILKIFTIVFLFVGFIFCLKLTYFMTESILISNFISILFFSSTVILYYGSLYLPDIQAFSLAVVGIYYFFLYTKTKKSKTLILVYIFMTLASLIKASFFYYECVFIMIIFLFYKEKNLNLNKNILFFILSSVLVFLWYYYAKKYNESNFATYYTISPRPFWKYPTEKIHKALVSISEYWYSKYYFQSTFHFFLITFLVYIFFIKKEKFDLWLISLLVFFTILYICLFLTQFIDHDYYFIVMVPCFIVIVTRCFNNIKTQFNNKIFINALYLFVIILSFLSLKYAKLNLHRRYSNSADSASVLRYQLDNVDIFLDSLNISQDSKFLVIGDKTHSASLAFLRKFGWIYSNFTIDLGSIQYNLPKADYLLILKPSENKIPASIKEQLANCERITFNSNHIYSLRKHAR